MLDIIPIPREAVDPGDQGLILPVPARVSNQVVLEPRDGCDAVQVTAKRVSFAIDGKTALRAQDIKIGVYSE
jgi:hypothetical protein